MAHELATQSNGIAAMFSVRETPWHKLGHIVQEAPTAEEAIKLAGLDWKVEQRPIYHDLKYVEGLELPADYKPLLRESTGYKALVRGDNNDTLSVMKDSYHVLQNKNAFAFFNPFVESGLASFETAGALRDGKVIWVLASLNKAPIEVGKGDEVNKYLLLSNSHDGTLSVRVGFTPVRVVCNNTLTMSHGDVNSKLLRIKHSSKVADRLDEVQGIVNAMDAKFEATAEQYRALAGKTLNRKDFEQYVNVVFKLRPEGDEREKLRAQKMMETITKLFENGAGAHLKSAAGTQWGAYNAVTEYLTHDYGKSDESRLYANWYGDVARTNSAAFDLAMEAV